MSTAATPQHTTTPPTSPARKKVWKRVEAYEEEEMPTRISEEERREHEIAEEQASEESAGVYEPKEEQAEEEAGHEAEKKPVPDVVWVEEEEHTAIRASTGEVIHIPGSVAPGTGTAAGPIATAKAALHAAEVYDTQPPIEVVKRGKEVLEEQERDQRHRDEDEQQLQERREERRHAAEDEAGAEGRGEEKLNEKEEAKPRLEGVTSREGVEVTTSTWYNVSQRTDPSLYDPTVPYITGFSNGTEITDPITLPATFTQDFIDNYSWLKGALYRNGPGVFDLEYRRHRQIANMSFAHWFDGLPLVHRFEIDGENKRVEYRSRFTANSLEQMIREHAEKGRREDVSDNKAWLGAQKMQADPAAVCANLAIHPNFPLGQGPASHPHLICTSHSSVLQEIDPVTLIPKHAMMYSDINPQFKGTVSATNPCRDPKKNVIVNYAMEVGGLLQQGKARYTFFEVEDVDRFSPPGLTLASITAGPTSAHSFALTEHYIVLVVYPYTTTWRDGLKKMLLPWTRHGHATPLAREMYFDPEGHTTFHVIDRNRREEISVYRTGPLFSLNMLNAFEYLSDGQESIIIDMNAYDDDEILRCWELANLRTAEMLPWPAATVRRYILSKIPEAATVYKVDKKKLPLPSYTHRTDYTLEFPRINPLCRMGRHRYAWGLSIHPEKRHLTNVVWDQIVKADLEDKTKVEWREEGCYPGEPIMVPHPEAEPGSNHPEDEGVILSVVLDTRKSVHTSFLLFLDATLLEELGRAPLPVHIPFGIHGM
ncbi:retinal pigment epithelial membrane protein-domain-containing protein [Powellomyces hirtus]|nr:retinal pigment epithelial membrane protein-domain-containing protein [Powellomyces hirtus]